MPYSKEYVMENLKETISTFGTQVSQKKHIFTDFIEKNGIPLYKTTSLRSIIFWKTIYSNVTTKVNICMKMDEKNI